MIDHTGKCPSPARKSLLSDNASVRPYRRLLAVIAFVALLLATIEVTGLRANLSLEFLQPQILANKATGLLIFVLLFALGNLIQVPGWIFLAAAVLTLGKTWGGIATYIAACLSCVTTFLAIRLIGSDALRQLKNPLAKRILGHLDTHPLRSVTLLRILFQTMPAVNYMLAMSGVRFRDYLAGTLIGLPLPIALYCLLFDYLATLFSHTPAG
ncbi:MAG: VTT domain-containing protein [Betaproteobacteria bacterium]|jgi:uncharacterized membrane protein YdjX (TVP38/TMEM64 family)|nr:VTT domain-containing protein [Betaproteobacteria bacterium]